MNPDIGEIPTVIPENNPSTATNVIFLIVFLVALFVFFKRQHITFRTIFGLTKRNFSWPPSAYVYGFLSAITLIIIAHNFQEINPVVTPFSLGVLTFFLLPITALIAIGIIPANSIAFVVAVSVLVSPFIWGITFSHFKNIKWLMPLVVGLVILNVMAFSAI